MPNKRILLFIDSNIKTIPYEIPLLELQKKGHTILFLSILEEGPIHEEYKIYDIPVFSIGEKSISLTRSLNYINFFICFCKQNKIDTVFAHLTIPSFISVLGQNFIKAKVICFRHHFNFINLLNTYAYKINKADKLLDKINARLASKIILPSHYLETLIHKYEGVPLAKMEVIPYVYNWDPFLKRAKENTSLPNASAPVRLLMISRLTKLKRPELSIELLMTLHKKNILCELTIVGEGDLEQALKEQVNALPLAGIISFAGFQQDVVPFINACDYLVHPSMTEASSSVIKEAGILGRPVIVCKGVGDFNDYIIDKENGWLVDPNSFCDEAGHIIANTAPEKRWKTGQALRQTVLEKFSLSTTVTNAYLSLLPK